MLRDTDIANNALMMNALDKIATIDIRDDSKTPTKSQRVVSTLWPSAMQQTVDAFHWSFLAHTFKPIKVAPDFDIGYAHRYKLVTNIEWTKVTGINGNHNRIEHVIMGGFLHTNEIVNTVTVQRAIKAFAEEPKSTVFETLLTMNLAMLIGMSVKNKMLEAIAQSQAQAVTAARRAEANSRSSTKLFDDTYLRGTLR